MRSTVRMRFIACLALGLSAVTLRAQSASLPPSEAAQRRVGRVAGALATAIAGARVGNPDDLNAALDALIEAWHETANGDYFRIVQASVDHALVSDPQHVPARALMECLRVTAAPRYVKAAQTLYAQPGGAEDVMFRFEYAALFAPTDLPGAAQRLAADADASPQGLAGARALANLVIATERLPPNSPQRVSLQAALQQHAAQWRSGSAGAQNVAAAALATYAIAKGVRLGLLPVTDEPSALALWRKGETAVGEETGGSIADQSAVLAGASEMAQAATALRDRGKIVVDDAWFNSQTRKSVAGESELFHYKWNDDQNSGFAFFGRAFQRYGARLAQLAEAPTDENLKGTKVYVIPSPDIPTKNPNPHFMDPKSADAIERWVKAGGVLLLMENDKTNSDFEHFNMLSERFGIHFNPVLRNEVQGDHFDQGQLNLPAGTGAIFPTVLKVYMKEICTITASGPAKAIFSDKGDVLMAVARVGKGTVYAVVDPWLYNEYTDGRKLPPEYQNFVAAIDLAGWALAQTR